MSCCEVNVPLGELAQAIVSCYGKDIANCLPQSVTDVKLLPSGKELSVTKAGKTELYEIDVNDKPGRGIGFDVVYNKVYAEEGENTFTVGRIEAPAGDLVMAKVNFNGTTNCESVYRFMHSQVKDREEIMANPQSFMFLFKSNGPEDLVLTGSGKIDGNLTLSYAYLPVGE